MWVAAIIWKGYLKANMTPVEYDSNKVGASRTW